MRELTTSTPSSSASALPASPRTADWASGIALFALTIFTSAFLLFQVQPLIAKLILPWFGGSAAVWTTCMLFFQIALLLGYLYAHVASRRLPPRRQAWLHIALLAVSLLCLPILPSPWWKPSGSDDPLWRILGLLAATIGLPYFLISSTSPLLQSWLARTRSGAVPYRLFALSNFGSMLALLSYPILVEPNLTNGEQAWSWSAGYTLFVLLCGFVAFRSRTARPVEAHEDFEDAPAPALRDNLLWLGLAASASALLLAVTNHLSQNVASIPFLWILPLTLYLLSFILCFESSIWYQRAVFLPMFAIALAAMAYELSGSAPEATFRKQIAIFAAALFIACMVCHGELARLKPASKHLTGFYLMTSIGGAIGGLFVAFIAPRVFNAQYEFPISIFCCALAVLIVYYREEPFRVAIKSPRQILWALAFFATVYLAVYNTKNARYEVSGAVVLVRNFYGALRVNDTVKTAEQDATRELTHGTINHGEQFLDAKRRHEPTTYYGPASGIGMVLRDLSTGGPIKVGVVGLGTGTIAAYGRAGDTYRYYEINPLVITIAQRDFTYLSDTPAKVEIALGDARLSLEREQPENFDVLAVDAFSSDSIPVHLLTREAFALYLRHLKPDGILAIHVSNRYLDLAPVVNQEAAAQNKPVLLIDSDSDEAADTSEASWVLVSSRADYWEKPYFKNASTPIPKRAKLRMWTDDYSNLWQILK
jgi:SAM-dependent methyltransferase